MNISPHLRYPDTKLLELGAPPVISAVTEGETEQDTAKIALSHLGEYRVAVNMNPDRLTVIALTLATFGVPQVSHNASLASRNKKFLDFMKSMEVVTKALCGEPDLHADDIPLGLRDMFVVGTQSRFKELALIEGMADVLNAAIDEHNKGIVKADPEREKEWLKMKAKAAALRRRADNLTPFDDPLSAGELRLLAKDDAIRAAEANGTRNKREEHHPNENAVSYSWMMATIMDIVSDDKLAIETNVLVCRDILRFWSAHGRKSTAALNSSLIRNPEIIGEAGVDIAPLIQRIQAHDLWHTYASASSEDKHLANHRITTKRLLRLTTCFGQGSTCWGLGMHEPDAIGDTLVNMWREESAINARDQVALSIVWYFSIARQEIIGPITDRNDLSGEDVLNSQLGIPVRGQYGQSTNAYHWDNNSPTCMTAEQFEEFQAVLSLPLVDGRLAADMPARPPPDPAAAESDSDDDPPPAEIEPAQSAPPQGSMPVENPDALQANESGELPDESVTAEENPGADPPIAEVASMELAADPDPSPAGNVSTQKADKSKKHRRRFDMAKPPEGPQTDPDPDLDGDAAGQ